MSGKFYLFNHHLYEYRKGLRNLVLFTATVQMYPDIVRKLNKYEIAHIVKPVTDSKVNIFFGHPACVEALRRIDLARLERLSPEEDFMLGVLLGYDLVQQCRRFVELTDAEQPACSIA